MGVQAIQKSFSDSESWEFSASNTCVAQCFSLLTLPVSHCVSLPQFPRLSLHGGTTYSKMGSIFGILAVFCIQYMCCSMFLTVVLTCFSLSFSVPQVVATRGCELLQNQFHIQNRGSFLHLIHVLLNVSPCCLCLFLSVSLFSIPVPQVVATQGCELFKNRFQIQTQVKILHQIHVLLEGSHAICCTTLWCPA